MADNHAPDVRIEQLQAQLAAQQTQLAALQVRQAHPRPRLPRRFLPLALVALLIALLPLSILAAGPVFSDLATAAPGTHTYQFVISHNAPGALITASLTLTATTHPFGNSGAAGATEIEPAPPEPAR